MKRVNLSRVRGDTYPIFLTFKDKEGNPVDITGSVIQLGVKDSSGNLVTVPGDIVDAPNGKAQIVFTDQSVANVGNFTYDIQMITAEGYKITVASGTLRLSPDVLP